MKRHKEKTLNNFFSFTNLLLLFLLILLASLIFLNFKKKNIDGQLNKSIDRGISYYRVKEVVDGDTIVLENDDTVRYLGLDTPEIYNNKMKGECGGKEALEKNQKLVLSKKVRLLKDKTEKDNYGRLLRYVFTEDGFFVNYELIRGGFAQTLEIFPDTMFSKTFLDAQNSAFKEKLGVWNKCFNKGGENK